MDGRDISDHLEEAWRVEETKEEQFLPGALERVRESRHQSISSYHSALSSEVHDTPEQTRVKTALDDWKKTKVDQLINSKYYLGFKKAFRHILFTIIIFMALVGVTYKCNLIALLILIGLGIATFRVRNYAHLRLLNFWLIGVIVLEYGLAISNLTKYSTPMAFPQPWN